MSESFFSQLEQRTQQVKITLANLEAEKVRIEGLIAQLQPIIPHYDALVSAERALQDANVSLDEARPGATASVDQPPSEYRAPSWEPQQQSTSW